MCNKAWFLTRSGDVEQYTLTGRWYIAPLGYMWIQCKRHWFSFPEWKNEDKFRIVNECSNLSSL